MQSVRVYAEDPLQQDWDEIAERLLFAINSSMDATRKETPFYLVHGWDVRTTLRAMSSSLKRDLGRQTDALAWRSEMNRQQKLLSTWLRSTRQKRRLGERRNTMTHSIDMNRGLYQTDRPSRPLRPD
ncbi:unnamed protein product [Phytophthora lilii]|uniref:Unnamed protein product n=1 Tax=Phytophthora lilii TaxID=2077276 RepID=A0A9W6WV86_9STRA|nr:unnamed protein product [Phytophthora lilii]